MIIFEPLLTTFKESIIFEATKTVEEIGLSIKSNHQEQI